LPFHSGVHSLWAPLVIVAASATVTSTIEGHARTASRIIYDIGNPVSSLPS
jgi:hypothetical protein